MMWISMLFEALFWFPFQMDGCMRALSMCFLFASFSLSLSLSLSLLSGRCLCVPALNGATGCLVICGLAVSLGPCHCCSLLLLSLSLFYTRCSWGCILRLFRLSECVMSAPVLHARPSVMVLHVSAPPPPPPARHGSLTTGTTLGCPEIMISVPQETQRSVRENR
jgi:hypothetical protein